MKINFDAAFDVWKQDKLKTGVSDLADKWGIDRDWLFKSVNAFSVGQDKTIPYIDELTKSVDYDKATDKSAGNKLKHMIILTRKLPELIVELKQSYE